MEDHKLRHAPTNMKSPGPAYYQFSGQPTASGPASPTKSSAAFASNVDRFRGRKGPAPGPGEYDESDVQGLASTVTKRIETSSRYGPFGSTNTRFPEESLAGMNRKVTVASQPGEPLFSGRPAYARVSCNHESFVPRLTGPGSYNPPKEVVGYGKKVSKSTSSFASAADRFAPDLPDVVIRDLLTGDVIDVRPAMPAPGQYEVRPKWGAKGPEARGGVKRDGFGSQATKVSLVTEVKSIVPGPGAYSPRAAQDVSKRLEVPTAFISQARRFGENKTSAPGPGQYVSVSEASMLRKSFNCTYDGLIG